MEQGRQFKSKYFKETSTRGTSRTPEGTIEAVNYMTGDIAEANSPKAANRQLNKMRGSGNSNNRKSDKVKLNKKETKSALENQRQNYNQYNAPYEEGPVTKSEWAGMLKDRPELKSQGLKFGKEDKAKRTTKKGR